MVLEAQGPLFHVPPWLSLLSWVCHLGEELLPHTAGEDRMLLFPVSLSSRAGPTLPGSIGSLLFSVGDWSFIAIPHSYMSFDGHN